MASRDEWSSYRAIAVACRRGASVDAIFEGTFVSNLWRGIAARLFFHRLSMTPAEQLFLLAFYRAREREWAAGAPINGSLVPTNKNVAQAKTPARGLGKKSCPP